MQSDPMYTMKSCNGDNCECVPDEVADAVYDSLNQIPGADQRSQRRDSVAAMLAPLMAQATGRRWISMVWDGWSADACCSFGRRSWRAC